MSGTGLSRALPGWRRRMGYTGLLEGTGRSFFSGIIGMPGISAMRISGWTCVFCTGRSFCCYRSADDRFGEAFHFFQLRTALKQEEVHACFFEGADAVFNLCGCAGEAGTKAAVRNGIVFQGHLLFQLRTGEPLLVVIVAGTARSYVRDPFQLLCYFRVG